MKKIWLALIGLAIANASLAQSAPIRNDTLSLCNSTVLNIDVSSNYPSTTHTHLWSTGATTSAVGITAIGNYTVAITEIATGDVVRDTVEVISSSNPLISFATPMDSVYYWGGPKVIDLSPLLPSTMSYTWSSHIDTTTFPFYVAQPVPLGEGLHQLELIIEDQVGCKDTALRDICVYKTTASCTPIGVNELTQSSPNSQISIFPNPAKEVVRFELTNTERGEIVARIINYQGAVVVKKTWDNKSKLFKGQLDVTSLPTGNYVLSLSTHNVTTAKSFVIK